MTTQDIIDFINNWRFSKGIGESNVLTEAQAIQFAQDLQNAINTMSFSTPNEAKIVGYNGYINGIPTYKIAGTIIEGSVANY